MTTEQIKCIVPSGDVCGEAVTWHKDTNSVFWVDINRFLIHQYHLEKKYTHNFFFDEPVVALSLTNRRDIILVSLASKLIYWNFKDDTRFDANIILDDYPSARFNDGRTDPMGNFWIGSMANNVGADGEAMPIDTNIGKLYKYDGNSLQEFENNIGIANTFCWSPDKKTFYFADTLENEIRAYDYDINTAEISNSRSFFKGFERGLPDGSAIDAEGYLWNCRYGGSCIVRIAPNGEIDTIIEMPVKNITTCAFGGAKLKTLYITTASADKKVTDRLAGSLFAINTTVTGLGENIFQIPVKIDF